MISNGGIISLASVEYLSNLVHSSSQRRTTQLMWCGSTWCKSRSVIHYFNNVSLDLLPQLGIRKECWVNNYSLFASPPLDLHSQMDSCQLNRNSLMLQLPFVVFPISLLLAFRNLRTDHTEIHSRDDSNE